uniref:Uncharacterized protein n=1 Tax=Glossina pallidipes TaxID=7398 RepID=A0A1B0AGR9_GLOPL
MLVWENIKGRNLEEIETNSTLDKCFVNLSSQGEIWWRKQILLSMLPRTIRRTTLICKTTLISIKSFAATFSLTTTKKSLNNLRIARASLEESLIKMLLRVKLITSIMLGFEYCADATVDSSLILSVYPSTDQRSLWNQV